MDGLGLVKNNNGILIKTQRIKRVILCGNFSNDILPIKTGALTQSYYFRFLKMCISIIKDSTIKGFNNTSKNAFVIFVTVIKYFSFLN